ncbi:MAG: hypothetical protein OER90_10785 [Gemmatimonadota bacterium]|nr:hypothetical protein [Gemmatimonadota bacterium]
MKCAEAVQHLMEADPGELRGEQDSPLSAHVRSCAQCRAVADRILEQEQTLREMMASVRPRVPADEALQRAWWHARLRSRRRLLLGLAPALAAAGLAGILIVGNGGLTPAEPGQAIAIDWERPPLVETAPGQQIAVFETDNPNIVVVWSF